MNGMRGNSFCWHKRHLGHFIKNTNCRDSKWKWTKLNWTRTKAGHYAAFLIILCSYFDLKFGMRCKRSLWQSNSNERTNKKICCCYGTVSFMNISSAHPKHWLCLFLFHHQKKKRRGKKKQTKTTQDNWWHKKCFENGFKGWNEWKNLLPENEKQHEQT